MKILKTSSIQSSLTCENNVMENSRIDFYIHFYRRLGVVFSVSDTNMINKGSITPTLPLTLNLNRNPVNGSSRGLPSPTDITVENIKRVFMKKIKREVPCPDIVGTCFYYEYHITIKNPD